MSFLPLQIFGMTPTNPTRILGWIITSGEFLVKWREKKRGMFFTRKEKKILHYLKRLCPCGSACHWLSGVVTSQNFAAFKSKLANRCMFNFALAKILGRGEMLFIYKILLAQVPRKVLNLTVCSCVCMCKEGLKGIWNMWEFCIREKYLGLREDH